jgi:hypothetical protein
LIMDLKALTAKARELEENRKHRFSSPPVKQLFSHLSFPSPRKDHSTGHFYYACRDCQRQIYLIDGVVVGTAIDGGHCTPGL